MTLNYNVLETYDNKTAAALAAYALSASEKTVMEAFGFSGSSEAFKELGAIFGVKPNTIKNNRDSFDPHTESHRVGWHQNDRLRPLYLNDVLEFAKGLGEDELIERVLKLKSWIWLSDLQQDWDDCVTDLSDINQMAELDTPPEILERMASFLKGQGLNIQHIGRTAIALSSKQKNQQSILSMAYLPKFKAIMPYVLSVIQYKETADSLRADLFRAFPAADNDQQKLFDAIRSSAFKRDDFFALAKPKLGSDVSVERLYKALTVPDWGGIRKSIFRSKSDVLVSVCQDRLDLENVKTGYVSHIVDYLLASQDNMEELQLPTQPATVDGQTLSLLDNVPRNVLYFGAPGTGKSHNAEHYVDCRAEHFYRTVFFADYQNADFVGAIKPAMDGDNVSYRFEAGPLVRALKDAYANPTTNVVLLIEEINRGNAPAIFGEMFQLLDRDKDGSSKYSITVSESLQKCLGEPSDEPHSDPVRFPSNLFIVATMNAGDQGVFVLDTAFKRRWHFKYMQIDFDTHLGKEGFSDLKIQLADEKYSWAVFAKTVNEVLVGEVQVSEDRLLGPFFLSPTELDAEDLTEAVAGKVLPYLWEDVLRYDDRTLLFDNNISSFAQLQNGLKAGERVFSDKFNSRLSNMVSQSNPPQETPDAQNEVGELEEETPRGAALDETSQ
ncbi:AAA family ATPase [Alphaproteobacteria bacterium]|nr:AAA family ATPase [Alphaproteobacteria bacterium]